MAAQKHRQEPLTTLGHHLDLAWMCEAYRRVRKDAAPGVDGQTVAEYGENLTGNLRDLIDRAKSGRYKAPPVKRAYVPKNAKEDRPIGLPTVEDKILQRAVAMIPFRSGSGRGARRIRRWITCAKSASNRRCNGFWRWICGSSWRHLDTTPLLMNWIQRGRVGCLTL